MSEQTPTPREPRTDNGAPTEREPRPKAKRVSKRALMVTAGAAAAASLALPWVVIQALPKSVVPADRQVVVVPSNYQFIIGPTAKANGAGATVGPATTPPVTATRASAPAPPGA